MGIIVVVFVLVIVGVGLFLLNKHAPMAEPIKTILNVVVILGVLLWLLNVFGFMSGHMPHFYCK